MVKQDIFKVQKGQVYQAFRLPALLFNNGVFLAFCEGRHAPADKSVAEIVLKRGVIENGPKGTKVTWGDLQVIAKKDGVRLFNPLPVLDQSTNTIFLTYKDGEETGSLLMVTKSTDNGLTWSEPKDITKEIFSKMPSDVKSFTPGPGHGIQMASGRLVFQGCVVRQTEEDGKVACAAVLLSDDNGESWYPGGIVPTHAEDGTLVKTNETSAVELDKNHLCINSRTLGKGQPRAQSVSEDGGLTFGKPQLAHKLFEPKNWGKNDPAGCEGSVLGFPSMDDSPQPHVLFSIPDCKIIRLRMSIRLSTDGCKTWSRPWVINSLGSGYSDMTKYENKADQALLASPTFAILYERGVFNSCDKVTFETFDFSKLSRGINSCCLYCCCCFYCSCCC